MGAGRPHREMIRKRDSYCFPMFEMFEEMDKVLNWSEISDLINEEQGMSIISRHQVARSYKSWIKAKEIADKAPLNRLQSADNTDSGIPNHTQGAVRSLWSIREPNATLKAKLQTKGKAYKVVVLPDLHLPAERNLFHPSARIAMKYLAKHGADEVISLGDVADFMELSSFDSDKPLKLENKRLSQTWWAIDTYLEELKVCGIKKHTWLRGNHEERLYKYIERNPIHAGTLELENQYAGVKGLNIIDMNVMYSIGELNFIHGHRHNIYHARTYLMDYHCNIMYGHTHDMQSFSMVTPRGPIEAMSVGCLSTRKPVWLRNKPNRWVHGFAIVYFFDDGTYIPYRVTIINDRTVIEGEVYKA